MKRSFMARASSLALRIFFPKPCRKDMTKVLEKRKAEGEKPYVLPSRLKGKARVVEKKLGRMSCYVFNENADSTILYLHGGAYVAQITSFHWRFLVRLAEATGKRIVVPIYPLAPFATFKDSYRLLTELYREYEDGDVTLMGDSAGGGLALGLWMYWHELGEKLPQGAVLFSPWLDIGMTNPEGERYDRLDPFLSRERLEVCAESWSDGLSLSDYRLSPMFGNVAALKNVTLFVGTNETLYPDVTAFFERLEQNEGCRLIVKEGMNHVYPLFPIPEAKEAFGQVVGAVGRNGE